MAIYPDDREVDNFPDEADWDDYPICPECDSSLCGDCVRCLNPNCELNPGHQLCGVDAGIW